ncbi:MAG: dynamin family protein [Eubacterium sp.]|nr:dynamin family protein [Eubacterium sp.]
MESVTCESCGYQNDTHAYFCKKCGHFLMAGSFDNAGAFGSAEVKLGRITENLKENPHIDILWNDTVDAYSRSVERIQSLLRLKDAGIRSDELNQKVSEFLRICRKPDFEIAFVGTIKTGKSTLINALLGNNYASIAVTPETAALTKFRSSEQDYIHITFYTAGEWKKLWDSIQKGADKFLEEFRNLKAGQQKNKWVGHAEEHIELANKDIKKELAVWSSSKSAVHYFVKEIEVGISTLPKDFPRQVVFVDTPGLSDPVAYRSQISRTYIRNANAVLVCVDAKKIYKEEIETIASVFSFSAHKKDKVYIIATHWDSLNDPATDWEEQKKYMVEQLTGKAFYQTKEMAEHNIMYASAYVYNLCRDYHSLEKKDKNFVNILPMKLDMDVEMGMLTPDDIQKLMDITNIKNIHQVIVSELVNQYVKLLYGDIKKQYEDIRHMVSRVAGERKKTLDEQITISYTDMKKIEKKIEETKENRDAILKCQKQLDAALKSVDKSTQKRLSRIVSKLV